MRTLASIVVLAAVLGAQTVSLQSVVVNGSQATVTYSKDFATCAHLKVLSGSLVHSQNVFCTSGTNVVVNVPLSGFNSLFQLGVPVILCHGNNGGICSAPVTIIVDPALVASPPTISLSAGGTQFLTVGASALGAGSFYLIAGSLSGSVPGFLVGQFLVPLNPDFYTDLTIQFPNTFPLSGFSGILDGSGNALAAITLPGGLDPSIAGLVVNHAVGIVTPGGIIVGVSAAATLVLVP